MTTPANTARATKRWKAAVGTVEYQGHTSAIDYQPNYSGTTWKGGDNNTIADVTPGDPQITITMAQDTENAESLYRIIDDSPAGTEIELKWYPHYDGDYFKTVKFKTVKLPLTTNRAGGTPEISQQFPCSEAVSGSDGA